MISSQRSPLWPYLLVLSGLFLLSLAVPRGSQPNMEADGLRSLERQRAQVWNRDAGGTVAILRPSAENVAAPVGFALSADSGWPSSWKNDEQHLYLSEATNSPATGNSAASSAIGPWAESVAEKIADLRHFELFQHLPQAGAVNSQSRANATASVYWPAPKSLMAQLEHLGQTGDCSAWAIQVEQLCVALCQTSPGDSQQAAGIVQQLEILARQADKLDGAFKSASTAAELRRVRYALERRLAVWSVAVLSSGQSAVYADVLSAEERRQRLEQSLTAADTWVRSLPYADAWRTYLLLDDVAQLANANRAVSADQSRLIAKRALARLLPEQTTEAQRRVLQNQTLEALADQLRTWTGEAVDMHDVLAGVEQYETSGLPSDAHQVAVALRQLDLSGSEQDRQLAQRLDEHYCNANLRIAVSAELLNRLSPEPPTENGVVRDTILGAAVRGTSTTNSQLHVKLIPDVQRLHLWIETQGTVDSSTLSTSGPATFSNNGRSDFLVHKAVVLDRQGVWIANAAAEANTDTQLTGVRTDYDNVPLLGTLVRKYAISQHHAMLGAAEQETDAKVATQANQEVNAQVKEQVNEAERAVRKEVLDPLAKLSLTAEPITLETTAQRLTLRLRIAGQNQLGGHTARPQALSDSIASVQVHESALNNILDQLQLAGRSFTLPELYRHVAEELSWDQTDAPADLPTDVRVTFAAKDPVRVRCQAGVVQLTLAIDELEQKGRRWNDFLVTANYQPQIEDLHVRLLRQGAIELGGDNYKGQPELALRGAFSKLFPRERSFELIPAWIADNRNLADLCISQCVVEDGWLAFSLGPQHDNNAQSAMRLPAMTNR